MDIFEEPENQKVLADDKVYKKMFFSQSRLYMTMQGCILMLGVEAQKFIKTFSTRPKITKPSQAIKFAKR